MPVSSQVQNTPLPQDLPFKVVSRTIGQGAYAFIRRATPLDAPAPVIAVKFINKQHAQKVGRVKAKQIAAEVALHSHVGKHSNIIQFLATGEDPEWTWIAMELADGDLFDKIEADRGVGEDIAHFYFSQLVSAVAYMHSKNVAHRDIKPENMLLANGDLKLADFGLAVLFGYNGQKKLCQTVCGSPPYMAAEVVPRGGFTGHRTEPYEANMADVWSCGIVLFVLLVGNTPWDEPTKNSYEFVEYVARGPVDELWARIPADALSLLKGMLQPDPKHRFSFAEVRRHPWFTRANPHLRPDGRAANPVVLATQMLENLRIDFDADPMAPPPSSARRARDHGAMDVDGADDADVLAGPRLALTQPETPIAEAGFDWEQRPRVAAGDGVSASQPVSLARGSVGAVAYERMLEEPALSQFSQAPSVPVSRTQFARRFADVLPGAALTSFFSFMDLPLLVPRVEEALDRLGVPTGGARAGDETAGKVFLQIKTRDQRACRLAGSVVIEKMPGVDEVWEVRFLKVVGDPLEWRRLFKKVAVLCKDAIIRPDD